MSSFDQAADRINAAVEKAEIGSEILSQVANGDEFTEVPTTSGPVPSLKKWQKDNMDLISGGVIARVDKAILSYPDYAAASAAAATLPDGQEIKAPNSDGRLSLFKVQSGGLVFASLAYIAPEDLRQFFPDMTGVTPSDGAIAAAIDAGLEEIFVPSGRILLTNPIPKIKDRSLRIIGAGKNITTIVYSPQTPGVFIDFEHTASEGKSVSVEDLTILTTLPACGTLLRNTAVDTLAPVQVNGQYDSAYLKNVRFGQSGSGYWNTFYHAINAGGGHWSGTVFDNHIAAAQSDPSVVPCILETTSADISMIRTLTAVDFYILRCWNAFKVSSMGARQVESFCLDSGEVVGVGDYAIDIPAGALGALNVSGVHFDVIGGIAKFTNASLLVGTFRGCDFRKTGSLPFVEFGFADKVSFNACHFAGQTDNIAVANNNAFRFTNSAFATAWVRGVVSGCTFTSLNSVYGLTTTKAVRSVEVSSNQYNNIGATVFEDSALDTSFVRSGDDIKESFTASLDTTGTVTVERTHASVVKFYPDAFPVVSANVVSPSTGQALTVRYLYDLSTNGKLVFSVLGNTSAARNVRISYSAGGVCVAI